MGTINIAEGRGLLVTNDGSTFEVEIKPHTPEEGKAKGESREDGQQDKITLSISSRDKMAVKIYAAQHGTTISALLHEWINAHCKS